MKKRFDPKLSVDVAGVAQVIYDNSRTTLVSFTCMNHERGRRYEIGLKFSLEGPELVAVPLTDIAAVPEVCAQAEDIVNLATTHQSSPESALYKALQLVMETRFLLFSIEFTLDDLKFVIYPEWSRQHGWMMAIHRVGEDLTPAEYETVRPVLNDIVGPTSPAV